MMLTQSPSISGSLEELSAMLICSNGEMRAAVDQIKRFKVADVNEQNSNIIITNRRRARDCKIKELRSLAGKASATKRQHTIQQGESTRSAYASASTSASTETKDSEPKELFPVSAAKRKPTLDEVKLTCAKIGVPDSDAVWFWNKCEGNGWTNGGKPIKSWPHTISSWKAAGYLPSQKQQSAKPNGVIHHLRDSVCDLSHEE